MTGYQHNQPQQTDTVCEKLSETRFNIEGTEIDLPVRINKAKSSFVTFLVDAKAAQQWIAETQLEVVEVFPGKALLQVIGVDYIENDLGDYNEAGLGIFCRQPGAPKGLPVLGAIRDLLNGKAASYIHLLPVNQDFTMHAGRFIWGYPKWNTDVTIGYHNDAKGRPQMTTSLHDEGQLVFSFSCPLGGRMTMKEQQQPTLAMRDGKIWATQGTAWGEGLKFALGGEKIELGDHPIADALRTMGLPKKPLFSGSVEHVKMLFGPATSAPIGTPVPL